MDVFVYGTLTNPERVREVVDSYVFVGPAVLEGLRIVDGEYPTLAPAAGVNGYGDGGMDAPAVAGRLLRTDEVDALDAYERVDDGLYVRVDVPVVDDGNAGTGDEVGTGAREGAGIDTVDEAAVYVGNPERLDAPAEWPGEGTFRDRVGATLAERPVRITRGR